MLENRRSIAQRDLATTSSEGDHQQSQSQFTVTVNPETSRVLLNDTYHQGVSAIERDPPDLLEPVNAPFGGTTDGDNRIQLGPLLLSRRFAINFVLFSAVFLILTSFTLRNFLRHFPEDVILLPE